MSDPVRDFILQMEIQPFDDAEGGRFLISSPGGKLVAERIVADIIILLKNGETFQSIASILASDEERIRLIYAKSVMRLYEKSRKATKPGTGLLAFRVPLLGKKGIGRITSRLSFLFNPKPAAVLLFFSALAQGMILFHWLRTGLPAGQQGIVLNTLTPASLLVSVFSLWLILFIHELGHASALAYFGGSAGEIGVGVYFLWFVFYTDMDETWKLERKKRALVDLGGVYFQCIIQIPLGVLYLLCEGDAGFALSIVMTLNAFSMALNLAPVLKFDGYWFLSDITGRTGLDREIPRFLRRLAGRKTDESGSRNRGAGPLFQAGIAVYTVIFGCASVYIAYTFGRRLMNVGTSLTRLSSMDYADWFYLAAAMVILLSVVKQLFSAMRGRQ